MWKGMDVVLVDDLIDTGGTLCKAAELILGKGASSVRAISTHAIMSGKAHENIANSVLEELIITDTIPLSNRMKKSAYCQLQRYLQRR
jgi:ribose-phosphate pyrophosphokinase